ncbi:MAG TPA: mechanosensitive ion channel family protein [Steroidobacteraceae bacterium]|nr:mechanosensitive ion channel family protein [Steroidobacteraceae bacterium]
MPTWRSIWEAELLWNTVGDWTLALLAFLVTFTVLPLVRGAIAARRRRWLAAQRTLPLAIELATLLIERTSRMFLLAAALYFAVTPLTLPHRLERALDIATVFIFWYQVGRWVMAAVRFAVDRRRQRTAAPDPALAGSIEILLFVAGLVVWTLVFLLALDNLGVEVKPLLAGLGIGGIAVALAVQAVLGDLLASMSIALDKPFTVGDALVIDGFNGTVEHIGVRSTRLRSISGEQIIMANSEVLKCRLRNYGRLRERRSAFELALVYDTPPEVLKAIPAAIRAIVEAQPHTRFDRCHLLTCGPTGPTYEIVYFVLIPDFQTYADAQHAINIAILERFRELKVQFATPLHAPRPTYPEA